MSDDTLKKCTKCGVEKPLEQFRNSKTSKLGKKAYCIPCDDEYNKALYLKNKEKRKAQVLKWNKEHPEKLKEYKRRWTEKKENK